MPCTFADTKLHEENISISVVREFKDLPILLADDDDKRKPQVGNPILPGSELPTEDFDENAEDELKGDNQRRRDSDPKEKPNL